MSVCPLVWGPLAFGVVGAVWPRGGRFPVLWTIAWTGLCVAAAIAGLTVVAAESMAVNLGMDGLARRAALPIGFWAIAFGWTMRGERVGLGGMALGGLVLAATSRDLMRLTFAIELVRIGTAPGDRRHCNLTERLALPMLCLGAAGCAGVTGSLDLATIQDILAAAHAPTEPLTPIGRPALVLAGSVALWMIAAVLPFDARAMDVSGDGVSEPLDRQTAALMARGLVGLLALSRTIIVGWPGLEPVTITVLEMLSLSGGAGAIWLLRERQRLDRLVAGFAMWLIAGQLLWLTTAVQSLDAALIGRWLPLGWMHDLLVLAAITAAAQGWVGRSSPIAYLDELRGLATIRPWVAALLLIPLASLLGGPLVAGGWLRLTMLSQLFALHGPGPDDLQWPRFDVRYAVVAWGVTWIVAGRAAAEIARVVLLETPLRGDAPHRPWWPMAVAMIAAVGLVSAGCWPQLLTAR
jgi:hypothetical protein